MYKIMSLKSLVLNNEKYKIYIILLNIFYEYLVNKLIYMYILKSFLFKKTKS